MQILCHAPPTGRLCPRMQNKSNNINRIEGYVAEGNQTENLYAGVSKKTRWAVICCFIYTITHRSFRNFLVSLIQIDQNHYPFANLRKEQATASPRVAINYEF